MTLDHDGVLHPALLARTQTFRQIITASESNSSVTMVYPDRIGPFRLEAEIGRGGMGIVYRAWDQDLHRWVAIKQMLPHLAADPVSRQRFLREARGMATIEQHPHLIPVYMVGDEGDSPYLVMPYLQGQSLDRRLPPGRRLAVRPAVKIARQSLAGLAAAHSAGLIHRDVKPSNLFLECQSCGRVRRVRVVDLGLARPATDLLSSQSNAMGTPLFMSPEQHQNQPLDDRTDVFSAGLVLFQMLTGRHPFDVSSILTLSYSVVHEPHPAALSLNPRVPRLVSQLLDDMLAKIPTARPTAAAAAAALRTMS